MSPRSGFGGFDRVSRLYPEDILRHPVDDKKLNFDLLFFLTVQHILLPSTLWFRNCFIIWRSRSLIGNQLSGIRDIRSPPHCLNGTDHEKKQTKKHSRFRIVWGCLIYESPENIRTKLYWVLLNFNFYFSCQSFAWKISKNWRYWGPSGIGAQLSGIRDIQNLFKWAVH